MEESFDRAWEQAADVRIQRLLESSCNGKIRIGDFRRGFPDLTRQLEDDRGGDWLNLWGASYNVDEFAGTRITDRKLLSCMGRIIGLTGVGKDQYHAGLLHTYGYCLSQIETRYGRKWERWISGAVADCLGLDRNRLFPTPDSGTLLKNLTSSLCQILGSFSGGFRSPYTDRLPNLLEHQKRRGSLIVEEADVTDDHISDVRLKTLLLEPLSGQTENLCIYWIEDLHQHCDRLITCFPMSPTSVDELLAGPCGERLDLRTRYNAAIAGAQRKQLFSGCRSVCSVDVTL